jgi:Arc/MetJ-type ribon-helix-helix transcriptional regulator
MLNIPLTEQQQRLLAERAAESGFPNSAEYVKRLIEEVIDDDQIEEKLAEALKSGPSAPMDDDDWRQIEREVERRIVDRRGG